MRIADMEAFVDVFESEGQKWTSTADRPYYDRRFIQCKGVSFSIGSVSKGFHEEAEYKVIGHIGPDGKMVEVNQ